MCWVGLGSWERSLRACLSFPFSQRDLIDGLWLVVERVVEVVVVEWRKATVVWWWACEDTRKLSGR